MKSNRFLPLIVPVIFFLLMELIFFYPKSLYVTFITILILLFSSTYMLVSNASSKEKWINVLLLPLYLFLSTVLMLIILPIKDLTAQILIQSLFFISSIFLYYYFYLIYDYLINKGKSKKQALSYFSAYTNFLSVYLMSSAAFGLQFYLGISIWLIMLLILTFVAATSYESMWINDIRGPISFFYIALVCLLIFELSWAVSFLTLSYYVLGLLISITYYVIIGLVKFQLLKTLTINIFKTYITLGLVSLLIVLITARWI